MGNYLEGYNKGFKDCINNLINIFEKDSIDLKGNLDIELSIANKNAYSMGLLQGKVESYDYILTILKNIKKINIESEI